MINPQKKATVVNKYEKLQNITFPRNNCWKIKQREVSVYSSNSRPSSSVKFVAAHCSQFRQSEYYPTFLSSGLVISCVSFTNQEKMRRRRRGRKRAQRLCLDANKSFLIAKTFSPPESHKATRLKKMQNLN